MYRIRGRVRSPRRRACPSPLRRRRARRRTLAWIGSPRRRRPRTQTRSCSTSCGRSTAGRRARSRLRPWPPAPRRPDPRERAATGAAATKRGRASSPARRPNPPTDAVHRAKLNPRMVEKYKNQIRLVLRYIEAKFCK